MWRMDVHGLVDRYVAHVLTRLARGFGFKVASSFLCSVIGS